MNSSCLNRIEMNAREKLSWSDMIFRSKCKHCCAYATYTPLYTALLKKKKKPEIGNRGFGLESQRATTRRFV